MRQATQRSGAAITELNWRERWDKWKIVVAAAFFFLSVIWILLRRVRYTLGLGT